MGGGVKLERLMGLVQRARRIAIRGLDEPLRKVGLTADTEQVQHVDGHA
jgi:hypothetical protein